MTCTHGDTFAVGRPVCPDCGARIPDAPRFSFDARRWTWPERIVGGASLMLLLSSFLPWFGVSVLGAQQGEFAGIGDTIVWAALIVALAILVFLVLRAGYGQVPFARPLSDRRVLAAATWLNLLLVLLAFLAKPRITGLNAAQIPPGALTIDRMLGAFIALLTVSVAALAASIAAMRARADGQV